MTTQVPTSPPPAQSPRGPESPSFVRTLISRISKLEIGLGAIIAAVLAVLVVIEPDILEAPFENSNTLLFTVGGTVLAGAAFVAMLWLRVPPAIRVVVPLVPFVIVNWWLLSPYFIDDVVDESFETSIAAQLAEAPTDADTTDAAATDDVAPATTNDSETADAAERAPETLDADDNGEAPAPAAEEPAAPTTPVLLGAGSFVGLAGHDGVGDAGIFQNPDGTHVLRFENFDIDNGPDLEVYLVPGADQVDLADGSIHLGALKGNVGDQTYELPAGTELVAGTYTVLVWCEAFSVEFVGANVTV